MVNKNNNNRHNKNAPYWAIVLFVFATAGLSTVWCQLGSFWNGYLLDMTGPAWNYILFRGLFTAKANNFWTRFFSPKRTIVFFVLVCVGIEMLQFFNIYDSTFDYWDFLAYGSLLIPIFFLDLKFSKEV